MFTIIIGRVVLLLVNVSLSDSLWVITYGTTGLLGLVALYSAFLVPISIFAFTPYPPKYWFHPQIAPAKFLVVVITLYMLDNTLNAMFNPIFIVICGGITGLVVQVPKKRKIIHQIPHKDAFAK
ncbi:MAG: hypothetical protein QNJ42_22550 [Crocosphaera sp.]|nr:hypothetical protein [Crocosphaera sp.]